MDTKKQQGLAVGLSIINSIGVIGTSVLTVRSTLKAKEKIDILQKEKGEEKLTKKEVVKVAWKDFILPFVIGFSTIGSGIGSTLMSRKLEASLITTAGMIDAGYLKYKDKVKQVLGKEKEREIESEVAKDEMKELQPEQPKDPNRVLCYERHMGFFIANKERVLQLSSFLNRKFNCNDYTASYNCSLGELLDFMEGELLDKKRVGMLEFGWNADYLGEYFENYWTDICIEDKVDDNGNPYLEIWFEQEPVYNYEYWYDWHENKLSDEEFLKGAPEGYGVIDQHKTLAFKE